MKSRAIIVHDKDRRGVSAELVICDECSGETFCIFVLNSGHQHIQCDDCGKTFCDGSCVATPPP